MWLFALTKPSTIAFLREFSSLVMRALHDIPSPRLTSVMAFRRVLSVTGSSRKISRRRKNVSLLRVLLFAIRKSDITFRRWSALGRTVGRYSTSLVSEPLTEVFSPPARSRFLPLAMTPSSFVADPPVDSTAPSRIRFSRDQTPGIATLMDS